MYRITCVTEEPEAELLGIKERIAMDLERYGDIKVVKIEELTPEQVQMEHFRQKLYHMD